MRTLLLGSASPARKQTLINAGIIPHVMVADLDEEALIEEYRSAHRELSTRELAIAQVQLLAKAKAHQIFTTASELDQASDVIVGCDSMLEIDGTIVGKPHTPSIARQRLRAMSGNVGYLHTGHCVIDTHTGTSVTGVSTATVHIAHLSDADIEAYIATGEPLHVAGSFTVDGFGGPFIERIEGDYHGIVGISLPLLRSLLTELGYSITEFWHLPEKSAR
ncbi:Maf family protein [Arcanobacterium pinnipediorum]|uniref:Nucleoside triphosphate pyrophosphatase n=1 Tax=Arcanobacterium pinnipediorum TaxID=1503041 RepID=A0ABY5AGD8_9ACTO|nr:nucleoside triphosphate pyrophosphatase [Arcanobacterium pinnipediorum]USR79132.1 Maf-like protein [Arcanobacterium pinnipediorum]